jgi:hypothetical protein
MVLYNTQNNLNHEGRVAAYHSKYMLQVIIQQLSVMLFKTSLFTINKKNFSFLCKAF